MKHFTAALVGFISGVLLYIACSMIFNSKGDGVPTISWIAFFGGWIGTHIICVRGTQSGLKVLCRGFLIGGLEWMFMILAGVIASSKAYVEVSGNNPSDAGKAGAAIGSGLATLLTGGVSLFMAICCFIGFLITYYLSKELRPDSSNDQLIRCEDCAELINVNAKKCKHCGAGVMRNQSNASKNVA